MIATVSPTTAARRRPVGHFSPILPTPLRRVTSPLRRRPASYDCSRASFRTSPLCPRLEHVFGGRREYRSRCAPPRWDRPLERLARRVPSGQQHPRWVRRIAALPRPSLWPAAPRVPSGRAVLPLSKWTSATTSASSAASPAAAPLSGSSLQSASWVNALPVLSRAVYPSPVRRPLPPAFNALPGSTVVVPLGVPPPGRRCPRPIDWPCSARRNSLCS